MVKVTIYSKHSETRDLEFPTASRISVKVGTNTTYLEVWRADRNVLALFNDWVYAEVVDEVNDEQKD